MSELEFLRHITVGQHLPTGSTIHRLDPRIKLLAFGALALSVAFTTSVLGNGLWLLIALVLVRLARIPLGYALRGVRPMLPVLALLAVFQIIFPPQIAIQRDCVVLWEWGSLSVTDCVVQLIFVSAARIVALVLLTSLLTLSTSTTELAHGTEGVLAPLQRVGFPAHELALIVVVALRFVPTLALQMERIVKAQVARGADFGTEGGFKFIRRTRRMLPLLIPLFLVSLRRAETLAIAMEARGYTGGSGRTRRKRLHAEGRDYVALLLALFLCAGILVADRLVLDGAIGLLLEMLPF